MLKIEHLLVQLFRTFLGCLYATVAICFQSFLTHGTT